MEESSHPIILLDLADPAEIERLSAAFEREGLGFAATPSGGKDEKKERGAGSLDAAIRNAQADFVLVDGRRWSGFGSELSRPPRSYILVILLDANEIDRAHRLIDSGVFDCILRGEEGWEEGAATYFRALASLHKRFLSTFSALERRYEDLVHALPDIVYELDSAGRFTFINNSIRLLGYDPAELAGKHFSVLLHEEDARAVDRESVLEFFRGVTTGPALSPKLFNERRSADRKTENLEIRLKRKPAGDSQPEDLIGSVLSYGEVTAAGEWARGEGGFLGSVGVIRDITLRRKSEEMLRKLYQAVDQLTAGVLVANRSFVVEYVNPAFLRLSGLEPDQVLGRELFSFFAMEEGRAEEVSSLVREGFDVREELLLDVAEGPGPWTAFRASPVRGPSGEISHVISICEDVSQRRSMEALLRQAKEEAESATKAKSDFLASMGHELKSPVASILAAARLIEMGGLEPEKRAASIISSAQGLLDLLGDILDFVRFETGSAALRKFAFPLAGFVQRTCEPFRARAIERGLGFQIAPLPEGLVRSDPDRLGRALSALLANALAFTEKGGVRIEATIELRSGNLPHLVLSVIDTGLGIAPEDQGRIFAPFVQLASPFTKAGGAGIGLSLARNIIRALGGELSVRSECGKGSVFTILVPVGEIESVEAPEPVEKGTFRLLVVDDNEVNLEYMAALLKNAGHYIDIASSGVAALGVLEERQPDAVIVDIQMPGMSGIELGRRIRSYGGDRYDPAIPLLALTAFDPDEVLRSTVDFDSVFSKPADIGVLLAAVEKSVWNRAMEASGTFGRRWAGRAEAGLEAFSAIETHLPSQLEDLCRAAEAGEAERIKKTIQAIGSQFSTLGALRTEASLRRLGLATSFEETAVLASRARRISALWERLRAEARFELGPGQGSGPELATEGEGGGESGVSEDA